MYSLAIYLNKCALEVWLLNGMSDVRQQSDCDGSLLKELLHCCKTSFVVEQLHSEGAKAQQCKKKKAQLHIGV